MVFLGPRANAKFVPKSHVLLHASLPILTTKFRSKVAPMLKSKCHHKLPSQCLMPELGVVIESSGTLHNFSPYSSFHIYFLHNRIFLPLLQLTFTRRTSGHCMGTFLSVNWVLFHPVKSSVSHYQPTFSSLSVFYFGFKVFKLVSYYVVIMFNYENILYYASLLSILSTIHFILSYSILYAVYYSLSQF
jgi:hypothetical protein